MAKKSEMAIKINLNFLKSPITILVAIALGVVSGLFLKNFSIKIIPFGSIYLSLLKMTIYPILMLAVITSIGKLFSNPSAKKYILRIIAFSLIFLFAVGAIGIITSLIIKPGKGLSKEAQIVLGKTLNKAEEEQKVDVKVERGFFAFLKQLIPENIFQSMEKGASLELLFFSIILGIAVGLLDPQYSKNVLNITEGLFKAFFLIISWILFLLPFGLFSLLAGQIATTGVETFKAMFKFVLVVYIICLLVFILNVLIISLKRKVSFITSIAALKEALLIGFGTQSTFASMPAAIEGLTGDKLKVDKEITNLFIPIGVVINRFSMIIIYTVATIFTAQLYNINLSFSQLITTLFLSVVAAFAGSGMYTLVSIALISIIFLPLGLPTSAIIILLLAINPVIDPFLTATNVYTNSTLDVLIAGDINKKSKKK